jgi:hypothetical protein
MELFTQAGEDREVVNSEINLLVVRHLAGKYVERERLAELTRILEEAGDFRAEKGRKLLAELNPPADP